MIFDPGLLQDLYERHGVLGIFLGSLPCAIQQNSYRGLPLILSAEEIHSILSNLALPRSPKTADPSFAKLLKDVTDDAGISDEQSGRFESIRDFRPKDANWHLRSILDGLVASQRIRTPYVRTQQMLASTDNYNLETADDAFSYLKSIPLVNPLLLPGTKFGGNWCLYPSYPARFHSMAIIHLVPSNRKYDAEREITGAADWTGESSSTYRQLIHWGRIANFTHKTAVIMDQDRQKCFSVEWTGW
jgi:hypothetical protein